MSLDDTLELDAIVKKWDDPNNIVSVSDKESLKLSGFQTNTRVINPQEPGNYTITVNGQELTVKVTDQSTIPNVSMFQSPIYQWYGSTFDSGTLEWTESLANLPNATATGTPSDGSNTSDSVAYDGGNDYHNWNSDSQLTSGSDISVAVLYYTSSDSQTSYFLSYGDSSESIDFGISAGSYRMNGKGVRASSLSGGNHPTFQLDVAGYSYNNSDNTTKMYGLDNNGNFSEVVNESLGFNPVDSNHKIASRFDGSSLYNGEIIEIVVSNAVESQTVFENYRSNRLS